MLEAPCVSLRPFGLFNDPDSKGGAQLLPFRGPTDWDWWKALDH